MATDKDDQQIVCCDCGGVFTHYRDSQILYEQKGFPPPKRCPGCRRLRRSLRQSFDGR